MPAPIDGIVKRRVAAMASGEAREKITADNNIGAGTLNNS